MISVAQGLRFERGGVGICFYPKISVRQGRRATAREFAPAFESWESQDGALVSVCREGSLRLTYTIQYDQAEADTIHLRLACENEGLTPVYVDWLYPFAVKEGGLTLGGADSRDWLLFRQGRHKNDLPAVCRLGSTDETFADALTSLVETGAGTQGAQDALTFVSDALTVLRAGKTSRQNLLVAFTTGADQLLECRVALNADHSFRSLLAGSFFGARLDPGCQVASEWLKISCPKDVFSAVYCFARDKAELYGARKSAKAPSVFCTWYYYGLTVNEWDVLMNLAELNRRRIPFDVYQIDEGWERTLGDWQPNAKFPLGMREISRRIENAGYVPGIWTSPFIAHESAPLFAQHPDWFLWHFDGSPCLFPMNNTVYRVLDITNPQVLDWVEQLYATLRGWGYRYHKLDFTRAAVIQSDCKYFDETVSLAAAYRTAVRRIRQGMGEDAYFLMCGGLYDPVIGLVDAQRTGSDTLSMWSLSAVSKKGGKAAPFTIKQSFLRYFMNEWWDNDPDALMVRRQAQTERGLNLTYGLLTDEEARTSALNQYACGGLVCSTEPMDRVEDDRLHLLRHVMPTVPVRAIPRDLFSGGRYPALVDVSVASGAWHTLCFVNWSDAETVPCVFTLDESVLGDFAREHSSFCVSVFDSRTFREDVALGARVALGEIPPHGSMVVKVAPQDGCPSVLSSDAHFSMGAEVRRLAIADGALVFEHFHPYDCAVFYTVRVPRGLHALSLPAGASARGNLVTFYLTRRGPHAFRVPLSPDCV